MRYVCSATAYPQLGRSSHGALPQRTGSLATMYGPALLVETLSVPQVKRDSHGNAWQYHSRGDRHSKVACWGILLDLMACCPVLVEQIRAGAVAFGINHEMRDFQQNRKKNLDLVICTPAVGEGKRTTFAQLADKYGIMLSAGAKELLPALPILEEAPVGAVRVALEAKAAMTAHVKALPRLHDELNSSHLTIHGASQEALAVGFVMVNASDTFISPGMNKGALADRALVVSQHKQPGDAIRVIEKVGEIPRSPREGGTGFDAIGLVVVDCVNDGVTPVRLCTDAPAPQRGDIFHYESMIYRLAELYRSRFG
jgi:hypothetical protein